MKMDHVNLFRFTLRINAQEGKIIDGEKVSQSFYSLEYYISLYTNLNTLSYYICMKSICFTFHMVNYESLNSEKTFSIENREII